MMALSPETARVEALYQDMFDASDGSIESLRAGYSALFAGFNVPTDAASDLRWQVVDSNHCRRKPTDLQSAWGCLNVSPVVAAMAFDLG
jgi:hypothetical protein